MAYAGQTLDNPVSGEKLTFIQTAADTDGELLEIELELSPPRRRARCAHPRRHRAGRQDPRLQERG